MVAEKAGDGLTASIDSPWLVQTLRICRQAMSIPKKSDVQRAAKDSFIRAKPFEPLFGGDGQRLIRDGAFRRPQSCWGNAKHALMIFARTPQLLAGVFRMFVSPSRKRRAGTC